MPVFFFIFYLKTKGIFICCFFQAEDGIRATSVTGVQTCALPICRQDWGRWIDRKRNCSRGAAAGCHHDVGSAEGSRRGNGERGGDLSDAGDVNVRHRYRSEERRVGKECSSMRSTYAYNITASLTS